MQITELKLKTGNFDKQLIFYRDVLGLYLSDITENGFAVNTAENRIIFQRSEKKQYYHFAFLVPVKSIESIISYIETRGIPLLKLNNEKIIHFMSGRSVYFYDEDRNIVEFIERPSLDYKSDPEFGPDKVIKINEIGMPCESPLETAELLVNRYGIKPLNKDDFDERFCWVGDYNGVIILVKKGRNWLPTSDPGVLNDFTVSIIQDGISSTVKIENGRVL